MISRKYFYAMKENLRKSNKILTLMCFNNKCDDTKDSFYKVLDSLFIQFPKYHLNVL
jgi:hypothetical protein